MKKFCFLIAFAAILLNTARAQDPGFKPGWYIIEKGAEEIEGQGMYDRGLHAGEAVFVYMKIGENYLCVKDFSMIMRGKNSLTKITAEGKLAILKESASVNNVRITQGAFLWVVKEDPSKGTATVLVNDKKEVAVPYKSIFYINEVVKKLDSVKWVAIKDYKEEGADLEKQYLQAKKDSIAIADSINAVITYEEQQRKEDSLAAVREMNQEKFALLGKEIASAETEIKAANERLQKLKTISRDELIKEQSGKIRELEGELEKLKKARKDSEPK